MISTTTMPTAEDTSMSSTHHPQSSSAMSTAASSPLEVTFPSILNPSPVTITEIILHIGSFLSTRSLKNALCVSKDWYTTLYPLLWQKIYLWQDPDDIDPDIGPSLSNLRQHASFVNSLDVFPHKFAASYPNGGDKPLFFPNLAVLEIDTRYKKAIKNREFSYPPYEPEHPQNFDRVIRQLEQAPPTKLQSLIIHEGACSNLEQIQLQLLMILKSVNLTRLKWITWYTTYEDDTREEEVVEEGPMAQLARVIQSGRFHQGRQQLLESLGLGLSKFRIQDLDIILHAFQSSLKELSLNATNFDKDSWKVIKDRYPGYLSTITVLDLDDCSLLSGSLVQDILCSVTSLEVFRADYLRASSLQRDRRSWVCLGLKELSLGFVRRTRQGQCLILDQLSRLLRLEVLNLHKFGFVIEEVEEVLEVVGATVDEESNRRNLDVVANSKCQKSLSLTMMEGLDCLKQLRRLRHLKGPSNHQLNESCKHCVWTEAEARWAVENWMGLEELSNIPLTRGAKDILEERVSLSFCDLTD